jgi:pyruvate formate lyase activating enzyme
MDALQDAASPEQIAATASRYDCTSVAYTYNDPVIFAEYAMDVAQASHEQGLLNVAVSAGYINPAARSEFFENMDAANIDLKGFSDDFYRQLTGARLDSVLDTLTWLVHESNTWLEVTTLLIPGYNDSDGEIHQMTSWIREALSPSIPLHFTAFHPANRLRDVPRTPTTTLQHARSIAMEEGLRFVYIGNAADQAGHTTFCPGCSKQLIQRTGYTITDYALVDGKCPDCGVQIPGIWGSGPGDFGSRRIPVRL